MTLDGLADLLRDLDTLAAGSFVGEELKRLIPAVGQVNKGQLDRNKSLPYSTAYLGRLKPSKLRVAGGRGDIGYGLDSLALYSDALFSFDVDENTLTNYSDLAYAGYQAELMEDKGSSFYAGDDEYFRLLELAVGNAAEKAWQG